MSLRAANYRMLNLYMNNRGATKGKRGEDKSCFGPNPEKTNRLFRIKRVKFLNLTLLMTDVATRYCQLNQKE